MLSAALVSLSFDSVYPKLQGLSPYPHFVFPVSASKHRMLSPAAHACAARHSAQAGQPNLFCNLHIIAVAAS